MNKPGETHQKEHKISKFQSVQFSIFANRNIDIGFFFLKQLTVNGGKGPNGLEKKRNKERN